MSSIGLLMNPRNLYLDMCYIRNVFSSCLFRVMVIRLILSCQFHVSLSFYFLFCSLILIVLGVGARASGLFLTSILVALSLGKTVVS